MTTVFPLMFAESCRLSGASIFGIENFLGFMQLAFILMLLEIYEMSFRLSSGPEIFGAIVVLLL